jgi:hypothetical protein
MKTSYRSPTKDGAIFLATQGNYNLVVDYTDCLRYQI